MRTELEFQWELLESDIADLTANFAAFTRKQIMGFKRFCEGADLSSTFIGGLKPRTMAIESHIDHTKSRLEREIKYVPTAPSSKFTCFQGLC